MKLSDLHTQNPYLELEDEFYHLCSGTPLEDPYLISFNKAAATLIDLDVETKDDPLFVDLLNGTYTLRGSQPFSMCYAGYQFGYYAPRLGDGRVHNIGTLNGWHLQTKGSGETLYSRSADGRAALPSSIREYLMSESMYHLGIPTTRALGIIGSKTKIIRNTIEDAAIVLRMSPSWVRFGTFEYFYYQQEHEKLKALADYVIAESYPHLIQHEDKYFLFFSEVLERTASLIAAWQSIGFCHGVMNTDNMSIAGLTIDYGPFSMMDDFQFGFVCNSTDKAGRYAYGEQPNVAYWNLTMLGKALSPLIEQKRIDAQLNAYGTHIYPNAYINMMRKKLGLKQALDEDRELVTSLIGALQDAYIDYTLFFRTLSHYQGDRMAIFELAMNPVPLDAWLTHYETRLSKESSSYQERHSLMKKTNPKYVLKNYMLDQAITLARKGDFSMVETLLLIAQHPYDELPQYERFAQETPEIHKNLMLSCSS